MKSTCYTLSFLAFFLLLKSEAIGQPLFSLNPDYYYITADTDTLEAFEEFGAYGEFEVDTEDTIFVKWQLVGRENCPASWDIVITDTQWHFFHDWITSNIDTLHMINTPMPLGGDYPVKSFHVEVNPHQTQGCCQLQVLFSLVDEPDSIIEVATFDFAILDSTCFISPSHEVVEQEQLLVYPNPANSAFQILANEAVTAAAIYDLMGNLVFRMDYVPQNSIETASLPAGLYLLKLELTDGKASWQRVVVQH